MDSGYTFKSKAHRLFFAKVTRRGVFNYTYNDYWDDALGENGAAVLRGFLNDKLVESAPTDVAIDKLFTVDELKPHLKARGLKVGGKKSDLVARILASDPAWAESQASAAGQYRRTTLGQVVADDIYDAIGREEGEMEARLLLLVHDGRYEEAFRTWAEWDADEVFPRDAWQGIDNSETDPTYFVQMAGRIEKLLPSGKRERAILNFLYGRASYEPDMLLASRAASYERDLLDWRNDGFVAGIRIEGPTNGSECSFSCLYEGCYQLKDAPDFPFGLCDNYPCCVCSWYFMGDNEVTGVDWKVPPVHHRLAGPSVRPDPTPITEDRYNRLAEVLGVENPPPFVPPKKDGPIKRFVYCNLLKRHNWRYVHLNAEGEKVFECRRCGKMYIAPR